MLLGIETFETSGGSYKPAHGWTEECDARAQGAELQIFLARIIHEDCYCNYRYPATTSLTAGGLAVQSVNILFQICLPSSPLHAPFSLGVSAVSSRNRVNNVGWYVAAEFFHIDILH